MFWCKNIPASMFNLPTNGAKLLSIELCNEDNVQFYKVLGEIYPVDELAPVINFEVNLPLVWNEKLVHFGGGGFNGVVISGLGHVPCEGEAKPTALSRGYATCGSDSGHKNLSFWDASWSLNDECLENFGHAHIKKVKDAVRHIVKSFYGKDIRKSYFVGSSNGGREALMAAQRYPYDYDGIIAGYPVFNWTPKILTDYRNMQMMDAAGEDGFISAECFMLAYAEVQKLFEHQGCMKDGLVQDFFACESLKDEALAAMCNVLNEKQLQVLKNFYEPLEFDFELANGVKQMQGFSIVQQFCDHKLHPFGKVPCTRDGLFAKTVDAIIRYQILRDENAIINDFDYRKHKEEVLRISNIMDATSPNLDDFFVRGSKVLIIHGTSDQLLSLHATIDYYKRVREHFGKENCADFIKLFLVPGFGHDYGEIFNMHADVLNILDSWVEKGITPNELVAEDQNIVTYGRLQTIKAYK